MAGDAGDAIETSESTTSVAISGLRGETLSVELLSHERRTDGSVGAMVRLNDRTFELSAELAEDGMTEHGVVVADDGATHYEFNREGSSASVTFSDARGSRQLTAGSAGELDVDAAALLRALVRDDLGLRTGGGETPYSFCYTDYCLYFVCDQAGSGIGGCADWRVTGDWCRVCLF
jgi:hypothetical protein